MESWPDEEESTLPQAAHVSNLSWLHLSNINKNQTVRLYADTGLFPSCLDQTVNMLIICGQLGWEGGEDRVKGNA